VAQILSADGSDAHPTEVITVADLLSRHARVPVQRQEPDTGGISVGALLRREGHAPHSERSLQLRPRPPAPTSDEGGTDRRVLVRRGAIAAGALLAAGSMLGAAMLAEVTPTANQTPAAGGGEDKGPYAGQGLLDPEAVAAAPDSVVIDQAAARDPLDPGAAAPSNWTPVAFPAALPGGTDGGNGGNGRSSSSSGDEGPRVAAPADHDKTTKKSSSSSGSTHESDGSKSSSSSSKEDSGKHSDDSKNDDSKNDDDKGDGDGLLGTVGKTVGGVVKDVGGVLGLDSKKSESKASESKSSRSMSLLSADDEEDSSAPHGEDDSKSHKSAKKSSDRDSEDSDSDDGGHSDDHGDRGLVGSVTDTVGSLLG
jgi:hypothetical protein